MNIQIPDLEYPIGQQVKVEGSSTWETIAGASCTVQAWIDGDINHLFGWTYIVETSDGHPHHVNNSKIVEVREGADK